MTEDASVLLDFFEYTLGPGIGVLRRPMAGSIRRESSRLVLEAEDLGAEAVDIRAGQA